MKKWLFWGAGLLLAAALQSTVLPAAAMGKTAGDLLLVVVVVASLRLGWKRGTMIGFSAGLLQDLCAGSFIGMNALMKMLTAQVLGVMKRKVFQENLLMPFLAVALATAANYMMGCLLMFCLGYRFDLLLNFATVFLPMLVFNIFLTWPVYYLVRFFTRKDADKWI